MLIRAASSYARSPVAIARLSQMLLTVQAPSGTEMMAGCGLWPRSSSVLSMTREIASIGWNPRIGGPDRVAKPAWPGPSHRALECERRAAGTRDADPVRSLSFDSVRMEDESSCFPL